MRNFVAHGFFWNNKLGYRPDFAEKKLFAYWIFAPLERLCFAHSSLILLATNEDPPLE